MRIRVVEQGGVFKEVEVGEDATVQECLEKAGVNSGKLMHGAGCDQCRESGYAGRAGIFELLIADEAFRDIINKDSSVNSMRDAFMKSGQPSLFDDGMKKVAKGVTTIEEVLRVTQVYGQNEDESFDENICTYRTARKSGSGTKSSKTSAKKKSGTRSKKDASDAAEELVLSSKGGSK